MNKIIFTSLVGLSLGTLGLTSLSQNTLVASAKVKHAKILHYTFFKKGSYTVNSGYMYTNIHLNKKNHKLQNYLSWTFYSNKSATVKRANGKKATYLYIKSGNGKIKGWVLKNNLNKKSYIPTKKQGPNTSSKTYTPDYSQAKSDISSMLSIVRTMYSADQDDVLENFKNITPKYAYDQSDDSDLSSVLNSMSEAVSFQENNHGIKLDAQAIQSAYQLFSNRFNSTDNAKLATLSSRLNDALAGSNYDSIQNAAHNLADALSNYVPNLQN